MHEHDDFYLDGESARSLGIILQREMFFSAAEPRVESVDVAGRNGAIILSDGSFDNIRGTAECYCLDTDVAYVVTAVNAWLMKSTVYRRLETFVEPEYFRMARLLHGADIDPRLNRINSFTLEFDCKPQKFLKYGEEELDIDSAISIINPTGFDALPIIITQGSGSGSVTINSRTISTTNCNGLIIDCEEKDATRNGENANSTMSGTFPVLEAENDISFSGGVTSITLIPRWWTL